MTNSNTNTSNVLSKTNRRISNDDLVSRENQESKTILGHKRSNSSGIILNDFNDDTTTSSQQQQPTEEENECMGSLMRNFNAYLVLEEKHYPVQPDIKNSESIKTFEEHRQLSVKLLRSTFEIASLEIYLKELQNWENDPNRDDALIYMRFCDENRNLRKLRASFLDQLSHPRTSSNSNANPSLEVGNGWIMVERPDTGN